MGFFRHDNDEPGVDESTDAGSLVQPHSGQKAALISKRTFPTDALESQFRERPPY